MVNDLSSIFLLPAKVNRHFITTEKSDLEFLHWHVYFPRELNLPQIPPDLMTDPFRFPFCLVRIRVLDYGFLFLAKEKRHTHILKSVCKCVHTCVYGNDVMKNIRLK